MNDPVRKPKHYEIMPGLEAIDIIDVVLTSLDGEITPYQAYCLGNFLKYRLRAGDKDDLQQDIDKSNTYKSMLNAELEEHPEPITPNGWPVGRARESLHASRDIGCYIKRAMRKSDPYPPNGC